MYVNNILLLNVALPYVNLKDSLQILYPSLSASFFIFTLCACYDENKCYLILYFLPRVEKKERARLKTVKFHARTGMIDSNRVSVEGQLPPPPRRSEAPELLLGYQGDGLPPPVCGRETSTCSVERAQKRARITV